MAVVFTTTQARFEDVCTVEEALPLLEFLKSGDGVEVDLSACTYLHTALLQLLLTILACIMLGNQYINVGNYRDAPMTGVMTQPTFPGLAWAMLLIAAIFLYCGVAASRRDRLREIEL